MKLARKRLGLWLFLLAYGFSVYWCFFRSGPPFARRPITITFAHWQIEKGPPDGFAAVIHRYEELNPRVKVEQLLIPGASIYPQWMRANLAGANGPDILEWGFWLEGGKDLPARYFSPLTTELSKPNPYDRGSSQAGRKWEDTFHDRLFVPRRDSPDPGQIYGVSVTEVVWRLFANVRLLRAITGSDAQPKTYDDLRKILEQTREYARRTGQKISGFAGSRDHATWISEYLMNGPVIGNELAMDDDGYLWLYNRQALATYLEGRWSYRQPEVVAGLQIAREVTLAMKPGFMQSLRDDGLIEFFRGQALFIFSGTWDATSLRRLAPFPIEPMPLPQVMPDDPEVGRYVVGPKSDGTGQQTSVMYLNRGSAHRAAAVDFLQFLTSVEGQQLYTDASGWLPAVEGVVIPPAIREFRDYAKGYAFGDAGYDCLGSEQNLVWQRDFYLLTGDQGSPQKLAEAMDRECPVAMRKDLEDELRNTLLLVKPEDSGIIATEELSREAAPGYRPRIARADREAGQDISEGLAFRMAWQLRATRGIR